MTATAVAVVVAAMAVSARIHCWLSMRGGSGTPAPWPRRSLKLLSLGEMRWVSSGGETRKVSSGVRGMRLVSSVGGMSRTSRGMLRRMEEMLRVTLRGIATEMEETERGADS